VVPGAKLNLGLCVGGRGAAQLCQVNQKATSWILKQRKCTEWVLHVHNWWLTKKGYWVVLHPKSALLSPIGRQEEREPRRGEFLRYVCRLLCGGQVHGAHYEDEGSLHTATHAHSEGAPVLLCPASVTENSISGFDKTNCEIYLSQTGLSSV